LAARPSIGYSQGGGATHDLIEAVYNRKLNPTPNDVTTFGLYLDAVDHNLPDDLTAPERRWPVGVFYLLNLYQSNSIQVDNIPRGDAISDDVLGLLEEYDVAETEGFNNNLGHQEIDDDFPIHLLILDRLEEYITNR